MLGRLRRKREGLSRREHSCGELSIDPHLPVDEYETVRRRDDAAEYVLTLAFFAGTRSPTTNDANYFRSSRVQSGRNSGVVPPPPWQLGLDRRARWPPTRSTDGTQTNTFLLPVRGTTISPPMPR